MPSEAPLLRADQVDRTLKAMLDTGEAISLDEARKIAQGYRLQLLCGNDVLTSEALQTALLTAVNTGSRAFLGGVKVELPGDGPCLAPWACGRTIREAVMDLGGQLIESVEVDDPVLVIGVVAAAPDASVTLYLNAEGWAGGVTPTQPAPPEIMPLSISAVLAACFGVSECFQRLRGDLVAGDRPVGLSLWRPDIDWRDPDALGPSLKWLPAKWWLIGLGHLGQAYAWVLGTLPFEKPDEGHVFLQDVESLVEANMATSLLARSEHLGMRKTRLVASRLEELGFRTSITERRLDEHQRAIGSEPRLALGGVDNPLARRHLLTPGYEFVVDSGLGAGARDYLDMHVHAFPASRSPEDTFPAIAELGRGEKLVATSRTYQELEQSGADHCGLVEVAGRAVASSFVGGAAACIVLGEVLRRLHGGLAFELIDLSLRSPGLRECIPLEGEAPAFRGELASTR